MQDAEPDEHIVRKVQDLHHKKRDIRDHKGRAEHIHAALKAARGQRGTQAGEQDEQDMAVLPAEQEPARQIKCKAAEGAQVPEGVDGDHAQDAQPAQGIQLPDTLLCGKGSLFRHACCSFSASSSSTR